MRHRRKLLQSDTHVNAANSNVAEALGHNHKLSWLALSCTELDLTNLFKPGVYILIRGSDVAYVGQSKNVPARIGQHSYRIKFDRVLHWPEPDVDERLAIEAALVRRFNPIESCNVSGRTAARDAEILARFGLVPDPVIAATVRARNAARWSPETRESVAQANAGWAALKRARKAGKSERAAIRARNAAERAFKKRRHERTVVTPSESVDVNARESAPHSLTEDC